MHAQPRHRYTPCSPLESRKSFGNHQQRFRLRSTWNDCLRALRAPSLNTCSDVLSKLHSFRLPNASIPPSDVGEIVILMIHATRSGSDVQPLLRFLLRVSEKKCVAFSAQQLRCLLGFLIEAVPEILALKVMRFVIFEFAPRLSHAYADLFQVLLGVEACAARVEETERVSLGFVCIGNLLSNGRKIADADKSRAFLLALSVFRVYVPYLSRTNEPQDIHRVKCVSAILRVFEKTAPSVPEVGSGQLLMLFDSAMELSTLGAADKSYAAGCWEKNMKNDDYLETSDYTAVSLSGSEACASISFPQRSSRLRSQFIKLRAAALELLAALIKRGLNVHGQRLWNTMLPIKGHAPFVAGDANLVSIILNDPHSRVKSAAARTTARLISASPLDRWVSLNRQMNSGSVTHSSFVPASSRIIAQIEMLHVLLAESLRKEAVTDVAKAVVQAMEVLVGSVSYTGLELDLSGFCAAIEEALGVASLAHDAGKCITAMLVKNGDFPAISQWIADSLLDSLLRLCGTAGAATEVYLPLLGVAFRQNSAELGVRSDFFQQAIVTVFSSVAEKSRVAGLKCLQALAENPGTTTPEAFSLVVNLLEAHLPNAMNDSSSAVRIAAHSCVENIGEDAWAAFGLDQKQLVFDRVVGAVNEDLVNVRLSALQALTSMFTSEGFLDRKFVDTLVNVCVVCLSDDHVLVRQKAATSVANMCHMQVERKRVSQNSDVLANVLISHDSDEDKVVAQLVRAMGFLFVLEHDARSRESLLKVIVKNISRGNAKLRWTACNALECIGRSNTSTRFLDGPLVSKLVAVIRKEDNFKVRVSALSVLRCNLESYSTDALAIETAQDIEQSYHELGARLAEAGLREYEALKDLRLRLLAAVCYFLTNLTGVEISKPKSLRKDIISALRFKAPKTIDHEESVLQAALDQLNSQNNDA